jgi:hypothetical protein
MGAACTTTSCTSSNHRLRRRLSSQPEGFNAAFGPPTPQSSTLGLKSTQLQLNPSLLPLLDDYILSPENDYSESMSHIFTPRQDTTTITTLTPNNNNNNNNRDSEDGIIIITPTSSSTLTRTTTTTENNNNSILSTTTTTTTAYVIPTNVNEALQVISANEIEDVRYYGKTDGDDIVIQFATTIIHLGLNCRLKYLNLHSNGITDVGATIIAELLKTNQSILDLILSYNLISNQGCSEIANALKINSTLRMLSLSQNRISTEGAIAIASAMIVNSTLERLYLIGNEISFHPEAPGPKALCEAFLVSSAPLPHFNGFQPDNADLDSLPLRPSKLPKAWPSRLHWLKNPSGQREIVAGWQRAQNQGEKILLDVPQGFVMKGANAVATFLVIVPKILCVIGGNNTKQQQVVSKKQNNDHSFVVEMNQLQQNAADADDDDNTTTNEDQKCDDVDNNNNTYTNSRKLLVNNNNSNINKIMPLTLNGNQSLAQRICWFLLDIESTEMRQDSANDF